MKEDIPYYRVAGCCSNCAHCEMKEGAIVDLLRCTKFDCEVEGDMICYDYERLEP